MSTNIPDAPKVPEPFTLDSLISMHMPRAAGERLLTIRIANPGGLTAHQTVEVASAQFGFDWEGRQLVLMPSEPLAALSAQDLEDLRKSARAGQSWHAYQAHKKHADEMKAVRAELDALKAENEALRQALVVKLAPDVGPFAFTDLLRRMVSNIALNYACKRKPSQPFWSHVRDAAGLGSNCSAGLASWAGFDPDTGMAVAAGREKSDV